MPFIRHTRDKRGYETTYVMHGYRPLQGPQRTRVLYLFRTPSYLKLGRRPLDEEIREALEHTHPDVSFDWSTLGRESAMMRVDEPRDRDRERERHGRSQRPGPPPPARPPTPVPIPIPVLVDDQSLLGRALGAERAARFRAQYGELLQRIARRSRTPEDRDRLSERAQRLNPDEWPDESAVQTHADAFQAEWEALVAELPARRRGRRGGRRRDRGGVEGPDGGGMEGDAGSDDSESLEADADASGIMASGRVINASPDREDVDGVHRPADDRRDGDAVRPEAGEKPGESPDEPAGHRVPSDD